MFPTTSAPNRGEQYESQRAGDAITEVGQGIHGELATGVGQGAAEPGSGCERVSGGGHRISLTGGGSPQSSDCPNRSDQAPTEGEDGAGDQRVAEVGQPHQHGWQRCADDLRQSDQHEKDRGPAHQEGQAYAERDAQCSGGAS